MNAPAQRRAFSVSVFARNVAPCHEWDDARWARAEYLAALSCPENVRELAQLAVEIATA